MGVQKIVCNAPTQKGACVPQYFVEIWSNGIGSKKKKKKEKKKKLDKE